MGDQALRVLYAADAPAARAEDLAGNPLAAMTLYWGAWLEFHPESELWRAPPSAR